MSEASLIPATHQIAAPFREEIDRVRALYFSRDPSCWPVFGDPAFTAIMDVRRKTPPRPDPPENPVPYQ